MQYPGLPNNRLIVEGVDLTEKYGLVLVDGYVLEPPEPKSYTVDIPGGNGQIDLTETVYGDVAYNNRNQSFTFHVIKPNTFEKVKTQVSNFLHGRKAEYKLTMDPGYTYTGRFSVTGYNHQMYELGIDGVIEISVSADPYKYKKPGILELNAIGGIYVRVETGRKGVNPRIEVSNPCKVIFEDKEYYLNAGSWTINDIAFSGRKNNDIYFNIFEMRNLIYRDLRNKTWAELKTKFIFEWYKTSGSRYIPMILWQDVEDTTWQSHMDLNETWDDQLNDYTDSKTFKPVYVYYEWGDL